MMYENVLETFSIINGMKNNKKNSGQTMILTAIMMGGIVLSASVIAGMMTFYQLREVNDTVKSGMALFAADSGVEATLNCYFKLAGSENLDYSQVCKLSGGLSNGTTYKTELTCVESDKFTIPDNGCLEDPLVESKVYGIRIKSVGKKDNVERVVDSLFSTRFN